MKAVAEEVLAAYRDLERVGASLTDRRLGRRLDGFDQLWARVLLEPRAVQQLVEVLRTTEDVGLRWLLRDRLLPPRDLALTDPAAFRAHPLVDFTAEELPIRPCLALVDLGRPPEVPARIGEVEGPHGLSWFAGLPAHDGTGPWPRNEDGYPLCHVAQVDLGAFTADLPGDGPTPAVLGLPETGVLQLFHDRDNDGNLDDSASGSWCLRWVEHPVRLLGAPDDLDLDDDQWRPASEMAVALVASVPSLVDHRGRGRRRYERVAEHLASVRRDEPNRFGVAVPEDWTWTSAWEMGFESLDGEESSLGGFGYDEWSEDLAEVLAAKLPLTGGDEHVLVFDVVGAGPLEDWFADRGHLQAWMRASDRDERPFDRAWCVLRTG